MASRSIIYYTDSELDEKFAKPVRNQLLKMNLPIVSTSLKPLNFGYNVVVKGKKGYGTLFKQILIALENSDADIIFHAEHDNLMHPSHFDFIPPTKDEFYYDLNWWKIHSDGVALHWDAAQVSGLCYYRELGLKWYRERVKTFDAKNFDRKFEPTVNDLYETWWAKYPSIDIRHDHNLTYNKRGINDFRNKAAIINFHEIKIEDIPGWSLTAKDIY